MKRIGMLTSGGDCQSLNATMRGVCELQRRDAGTRRGAVCGEGVQGAEGAER